MTMIPEHVTKVNRDHHPQVPGLVPEHKILNKAVALSLKPRQESLTDNNNDHKEGIAPHQSTTWMMTLTPMTSSPNQHQADAIGHQLQIQDKTQDQTADQDLTITGEPLQGTEDPMITETEDLTLLQDQGTDPAPEATTAETDQIATTAIAEIDQAVHTTEEKGSKLLSQTKP
jgi:hypothetical protein